MEANSEPQAAVTIRELSRCAAALLDEVERTGRRIVISRYGRAAAVLSPIKEGDVAAGLRRWHVTPRYESWGPEQAEAVPPDDLVEIDALNGKQVELLRAIGEAAPGTWDSFAAKEFKKSIVLLTRLEFAGLIDGHSGMFRITDRGIRALALLRDAGR
jgi:prevent-host-death family protein